MVVVDLGLGGFVDPGFRIVKERVLGLCWELMWFNEIFDDYLVEENMGRF